MQKQNLHIRPNIKICLSSGRMDKYSINVEKVILEIQHVFVR